MLRDPVLGPEGNSLFEDMSDLQQDSRYKEGWPVSLTIGVVVSQPMDFRTVETKLQQGAYECIWVIT